jgi:hypothetical protein
MLVATHMKAGGRFPKKGTADYDQLKAKLDASKSAKAAPAAPAAPAAIAPSPAAAKARGRPKSTGVPMPATDAPIANEVAALPVAKKPRTRKVAASKVALTKDDEIMESPSEVVIQKKQKLNRKVVTTEMMAADALPKISKSVKPNLVANLTEKKGLASTIPLARISGTTGIRIPFTDRLMPTVNPI